jgi:hypothetical protein
MRSRIGAAHNIVIANPGCFIPDLGPVSDNIPFQIHQQKITIPTFFVAKSSQNIENYFIFNSHRKKVEPIGITVS